MWFKLYSRSRGQALDSSGFEHVFAGEIRGNRVTGFHSWIQYYLEEQEGNIRHNRRMRRCEVMPLYFILSIRSAYACLCVFSLDE